MILKAMMAMLMVLVMISGVMANTEDVVSITDEFTGDADAWKADELSWWDKIRLSLSGGSGSLDTLGGAVCSTSSDYSKEYTPSSSTITRLCYTNSNHIGVVTNLFEVQPDYSWTYIGQIRTLQGEKKCFDVQYGKTYHYQHYYCDDTSSSYTCTDSDGNNKDIYGNVKFTKDGSSETFYDECISSTTVLERLCDIGNTPVSTTYSCSGGCSGGACVTGNIPCLEGSGPLQPGQQYCDVEPPVTDVDIDFVSLQITNNGNLIEGQEYEIKGTAKITGTCTGCIIESGLDYYGSALSTVSSSSGACGDDQSVGVKFNANDGDYVSFTLVDKATVTGQYSVKVIASNGCYADVGSDWKTLDIDSFTLDIKEAYVPPEITKNCFYCSGDKVVTTQVSGDMCPDDLSPSIPDCEQVEPQVEVTCYYCAGTEVRSSVFTGSCPEDTSDQKPDCQNDPVNTKECYYCAGTEVRKTVVTENTCPTDTQETEPTCGLPPGLLTCYYCAGTTAREVTLEGSVCPEGTQDTQISCEEPLIDPDCTNDPDAEGCDPGDSCDDHVYVHANPDECNDPNTPFTIYYVLGGLVLASAGGIYFIGRGGKKK